MTWVAWRVQRLQLLVTVAAAAGFAVWMKVVLADQHAAQLALAGHGCPGGPGLGSLGCQALLDAWYSFGTGDRIIEGVLLVVPGLVGIVLGTPMVAREIEHGTNRLAWTQGISRTRWLAVKLGLAGTVVAAVVGGLALLQWWIGNGSSSSPVTPYSFDISGFVAVGYGLFAFALGAALGAAMRRTGWALALGALLFVLARVTVQRWVRPHLAPIATVPSSPEGAWSLVVERGWVLNQGYVPIGRSTPGPGQTWFTGYDAMARCKSAVSDPAAISRCAAADHLHYVVQYQPAAHYWALQAWETAIFVGAALVLVGITVALVRRWRT